MIALFLELSEYSDQVIYDTQEHTAPILHQDTSQAAMPAYREQFFFCNRGKLRVQYRVHYLWKPSQHDFVGQAGHNFICDTWQHKACLLTDQDHYINPKCRFAATRPRRHCLGLPVSATTLSLFLRFRTGCHGLPVDQGRWGTRVPRSERFCHLCNIQAIGDERHIVFECPALHDLRARYDSLFRPSITTMRQFMWQADLVQVAQFIRLSLGRVYTDLKQ